MLDGRTIGLGNDRIIYEMKPGAAEFTAIAATEGHRRAYFDEAAGIVRYIYANGALMELTSDGVVETALPQAQQGVERHKFAPRDDLMPRYIPALQGHFAIDDEQLWFLGQNAYEWISILRFDRNLTPASYKVFFDPTLWMMHLQLSPYNYTYFASFNASRGIPEFAYVTHNYSGSARVGDSILVKQRQYYEFWRWKTNNRTPYAKLLVLGRDGANDVPNLPEVDIDSDALITPFLTFPEPSQEIVMVRLQQGRMIFDGDKLIAAPSLDALPRSVWPVQINGQNFLTNSKALFRVGADLSVTEVALPTHDGFEAYTSKNFGGAFFSHRWTGDLFFTSDLVTFEPVSVPPDVTITEVKSDLPDAPATLAVGSGGLYLIQHCKGADQ